MFETHDQSIPQAQQSQGWLENAPTATIAILLLFYRSFIRFYPPIRFQNTMSLVVEYEGSLDT